jgi:hypothetical protein
MSTALKLRRGTTAQHSTFTGAEGEVTVDTTKDTVVVHDGSTAGGFPLLRENNPSYTGTLTGPTINLSQGQIVFPATQVPSTNANTLDDYEEGTWTPTVTSGTAVILPSSATYTKIGNRVICSFRFSCTTSGTITSIGGLPFTVNGQTDNGAVREWSTTGFMWSAQPEDGSSRFFFRRYDNDATMPLGSFSGTIIYRV